MDSGDLSKALRSAAQPLQGKPSDYDPIFDRLQGVDVVLLGEASHGTHEFYDIRALITKRLITEKGFNALAVEGDWPDVYRINRYIQGQSRDQQAVEALDNFRRFPAWMWRNTVVLDLVSWLRDYNSKNANASPVGFYGLDLYSLYSSMEEVINYLEKVDQDAARRARQRYACFEDFGEDAQLYGQFATLGLETKCEDEVVAQLTELQKRTNQDRDAMPLDNDARFCAEQNANVARNAEAYYRTMFQDQVASWNLRDEHMFGTLERLMDHLQKRQGRAKVVVWAHNSHLGDARATQMGKIGELNLGQLARQRFGARATSVGFSTYSGTVTAASQWGDPAQRMDMRPGAPGSYEELFHATGHPSILLDLKAGHDAIRGLRQARLQRAIGVIYLPLTERVSHYFMAKLPDQFDWMLHIDETRALAPLDSGFSSSAPEAPETFPSSL